MTYVPHPLFDEPGQPDARQHPLGELSRTGQQRRAAMLPLLTAAVRRRRRLRKATQTGGLAAAAVAMVWFALSWSMPSALHAPEPHEAPWRMANADFEWIRPDQTTTAGILQRWAAPEQTSVVRIADNDLADWLHAAGKPSGVVIIDGIAQPIIAPDDAQAPGE